MATNAQDRAQRRSSVSAARRAASQPIETPEALTDVMEDAAQSPVEEPQAPSTPRTRLPQQGTPAEAVSEPAQSVAARPASRPPGGGLSLPMRDLSRELGPRDFVIPKLKLAHNMSGVSKLYATSRGKEGIPPGVYYHTTGNRELSETVYFIPCDVRKSRSLFEQGIGVVCRSFDMLHGEGNPGGLCEGTAEEMHSEAEQDRGCPLRLWNRTSAGNKPPSCQETYNYTGLVIVDPEHPETSEVLQAMYQMRSTAVTAAKNINTAVMMFGGGVWADTIIRLDVEVKSGPRGDYYVPVADFFDTTEANGWDRIARRARAFSKQLGAADMRATIETDPDND
jgi:hypothetical protein